MSHCSKHFITQYISLRGTAVNEFYRMIRMGVGSHFGGKAKVKLTHIVGPTMCADKSWTIWHPISTVCKRVWLTWSHKIYILVSVKHFSPTNVCVMTFTETDLSQTSKLSRSWTSTQEAVNMAAPCRKFLWGWYVSRRNSWKIRNEQKLAWKVL